MLDWLRFLLRPDENWEFRYDEESGWWDYCELIEWSLPHNDWRFVKRWGVSEGLINNTHPPLVAPLIIRNLKRLHGG